MRIIKKLWHQRIIIEKYYFDLYLKIVLEDTITSVQNRAPFPLAMLNHLFMTSCISEQTQLYLRPYGLKPVFFQPS